MLKRLIIAAAAAAALAGAAVAETPTTAEACLKSALDIAQTAEQKDLPTEQLDRIEDLLTKMEAHCDANQFKEAAAIAKDIEGVIATKQ